LAKRELATFEEFRRARLDDVGYVVTTDAARPPIVHRLNGRCISADGFKVKVVLDGRGTGKYYWVDSFSSAAQEFGASACKLCKPLSPEKGPGKARIPGLDQPIKRW
jgi:hypothetical protein